MQPHVMQRSLMHLNAAPARQRSFTQALQRCCILADAVQPQRLGRGHLRRYSERFSAAGSISTLPHASASVQCSLERISTDGRCPDTY